MDSMHRLKDNVPQVQFPICNYGIYEKSLKRVKEVFVTTSTDYVYEPLGDNSKFGFELGGSDFLTHGVRSQNFRINSKPILDTVESLSQHKGRQNHLP